MTYKPTAEDYIFLYENSPEVFADRGAARTVINQIRSTPNTDVDQRLDALGRNYAMGGNAPLTASPIPVEADADGDGVLDPGFAAVCTDCVAGEPCCLKTGRIIDADVTSRKLEWPPEAGQTKMLVVAKHVEGDRLVAKLKTEWEGRACAVGKPNNPFLAARGLSPPLSRISAQKADVNVGDRVMLSTVVALKKYVPENVLYALMALDFVLALRYAQRDRSQVTFTPNQCVTDGAMETMFTVIPVPYAKLDGKVEMATQIRFTTAGVSGTASAKGSLTGQYGNTTITAEGKAAGSSNTGRVRDEAGGERDKGWIGAIADFIGTIDHYVAAGAPERGKLDLTQFASGITMSKSLVFHPTGFELVGQPGTPDLILKIGSLETTLQMGISGRLDFIDLLAMRLGGKGQKLIREARARLAQGETVKGKLDAYLDLSCNGEIKHTINSGAEIIIPANGDWNHAFNGLSEDFGGSVTIRGEAKVAIEIEAEVWIFKGKAGASGSVHTSWKWEMRKQNGEGRQKRYTFEGLVVTGSVHASAGLTSSENGVSQELFAVAADATGAGQAVDIFDAVREGISVSDAEEARMEAERFIGPTQEGDRSYSIFDPRQTEWEDY